MNQKFKIGDRVRIKGAFGIHKGEYLIEDLISESISYKLDYFSGSYSDRNLELVQTSEQIAVEKFKEELKEKINAMIILLGQCSDVYIEVEVKKRKIQIDQLKKILKLLET